MRRLLDSRQPARLRGACCSLGLAAWAAAPRLQPPHHPPRPLNRPPRLPHTSPQEDLIKQKEGSGGRAVYCLCAEGARAGAFILGYVLSTSPHREFFAVTPDGYYFRKKV